MTRALHEDGLADTADGLGPHGLDATRRLEIMRDSRNGTFGVLALALSVLIKVACLAQFSGATGLVVLIGAHALSRAVLAWPLLAFAPVHSDGLGAQVGKPTDNDVWLTLAIGAGLAFILLLFKGLFAAILAPAVSILAAWFASRWIAERLGGYTGDTLGAVQQKAEMAFLIVAALLIQH
jgi:adenosylcobinamide-GDP ribazoletransferase